MDKYNNQEIVKALEHNVAIINSLTKQLTNKDKIISEKNIQLETWDRVSNSDNWFEMGAVAKLLNIKNFGRNRIFDFLRGNGILRENNEPYQQFVDMGYFKLIEQDVILPNGDTLINRKTVISQKGVDYIRKKLYKVEENE